MKSLEESKKIVNSLLKSPAGSRISIWEQEDISLGLDVYQQIFSLCTSNVLMFDFDFKLGYGKNDVYKSLSSFTKKEHNKKNNLLFKLYHTDRGIHAFLVNKYVDFKSDEANKLMLSIESDNMYIANVEIRGYCVRLNPKIMGAVREGETINKIQDIVDKEFVSKPVIGQNEYIGYGNPSRKILDLLDFSMTMTAYFNKYYRNNLKEVISKEYVPGADMPMSIPPKEFLDKTKDYIINTLSKYNLLKEESKFVRNYKKDNKDQNIFVVYSQNNSRIEYGAENGIFAMCTNDVLMVDFDLNDEITERSTFIDQLEKFCDKEHRKGKDYKFVIYDSDKGVHAFLINKFVDHKSKESDYILKTLTPDNFEHTNFVKRKSHCVRIGPKIYLYKDNEYKYLNKHEITSQFVEKRVLGYTGHGNENYEIIDILRVKDIMVSTIKHLYESNFDNMMQEYQYKGNPRIYYKPKEEIINNLHSLTIEYFDKFSIKTKETTDDKSIWKNKLVNSIRYEDLFDSDYLGKDKLTAMNNCSRRSLTKINKNKSAKDERLTDNIQLTDLVYITNDVSKTIEKASSKQINLLRGPQFPFILGFDKRMKIFYIILYDLLTLDWDTVEGMPKSSTPDVAKRFINSEKLLDENHRVTKSELCFKLYETDNGVHAYIVSHKMPFYENKSGLLMTHTCSDFIYAAFSRNYGYSLRLSPKVYNKDMTVKSDNEIKSQFVQTYGVKNSEGEMKDYIGNKDNIDPYLDSLTTMVLNIQKRIVEIKDLKEKVLREDYGLMEEVKNIALDEFQEVKKKRTYITKDNILWATGAYTYTYSAPK